MDPPGTQGRRKQLTEQECAELLDEVENLLNLIDKEMDKNEKYHPAQDLVGCPEKWEAGGHMNEIEQWLEGIQDRWTDYAEGGCYRFERIRIRAGRLVKMQNLLEKRVAQWLSKLQQLGDNLLKQLVNQLRKNPQIWKRVLSLLRRAAKFVPYIGQIITIILFIYDWYTGGFWHAVKSAVIGSAPYEGVHGEHGTIFTAWRYRLSALPLLSLES